jgi:hypothetical protein
MKFLTFLYNAHLITENFYARKLAAHQDRLGNTWRLSGFTAQNFDAGVIDIGHMSKDQALEKCAKLNPRASIIHVDEDNRIVTYRLAE